MKVSRNSLCPCGSKKKYKRCCLGRDREPSRSLYEKVRAGEVPYSARISSSDGEGGGLLIDCATVAIDGRTTVSLGPVALSVNAVHGDKIAESSASISVPVDGTSPGLIRTTGNATVSVVPVQSRLELSGTKREIKARSPNGLFAVASVKVQRQDDLPFFDLLFGVRGQPELLDPEGQKLRPHIAFRPDGNGKYIRLAGTRCELETIRSYSPVNGAVTPEIVRVHLHDHQESLELRFSSAGVDLPIVLNSVRFLTVSSRGGDRAQT